MHKLCKEEQGKDRSVYQQPTVQDGLCQCTPGGAVPRWPSTSLRLQAIVEATAGRRSALQFFISQDAAFLAAFASAYATAARTAEQQHLDSNLVESIKSLLRGVEEELRMHESYAAVRACAPWYILRAHRLLGRIEQSLGEQ